MARVFGTKVTIWVLELDIQSRSLSKNMFANYDTHYAKKLRAYSTCWWPSVWVIRRWLTDQRISYTSIDSVGRPGTQKTLDVLKWFLVNITVTYTPSHTLLTLGINHVLQILIQTTHQWRNRARPSSDKNQYSTTKAHNTQLQIKASESRWTRRLKQVTVTLTNYNLQNCPTASTVQIASETLCFRDKKSSTRLSGVYLFRKINAT